MRVYVNLHLDKDEAIKFEKCGEGAVWVLEGSHHIFFDSSYTQYPTRMTIEDFRRQMNQQIDNVLAEIKGVEDES